MQIHGCFLDLSSQNLCGQSPENCANSRPEDSYGQGGLRTRGKEESIRPIVEKFSESKLSGKTQATSPRPGLAHPERGHSAQLARGGGRDI